MSVVIYARHTPEVNGNGTAQVALTPSIGYNPLEVLFRTPSTRRRIIEQADERVRQKYAEARGIIERYMGSVHDFEFEEDFEYSKKSKQPWSFACREMSRDDYLGLLIALEQIGAFVHQARHVVSPRIREDPAKMVLDDLVLKAWKASNGSQQSSSQ